MLYTYFLWQELPCWRCVSKWVKKDTCDLKSFYNMQGVTLLGKAQYGEYATFQNTSPLIGAILIWNWSTHLDPLQSSDKSKTLHAATLMRTLGGFKFPQAHFNWGFPTQHEIYSSKFKCHSAFAFVRTSQPQSWALTLTVNNLTENNKEQLWRQI